MGPFGVLVVLKARKEFLLSTSKDLKRFCMNYMRSGDHEKKSKHIKPVVKLLHQLIVVSCKEQPEVMYYIASYSYLYVTVLCYCRHLLCASVVKSY